MAPIERRQASPEFRTGYTAGWDGVEYDVLMPGDWKSGWTSGQSHARMLVQIAEESGKR